MRSFLVSMSALVLVAAISPASAQSTLDKIKAQGFVQCGSEVRPGLAEVDDKGHWSGLNVEVCRAAAVAVFGPDAKFAFHRYEAAKDFDTIRNGSDQIAFLTFSEMAEQKLTGALVPGASVFVETHDLLVADDSPVRHAEALAKSSICFITGTPPNASLDAWFEARHMTPDLLGLQEDGEMYDAYAVQRCKAVVGESTTLANARLDGGINNLKSRLLPEHLAAFPILAATPVSTDSQWAGIVAWTIDTLKVADRKETPLRAGGLRTLAIDGTPLGLKPDWQQTIVATVGSYDDIFRRTLGAESRLKLARGLNGEALDGGTVLPPATE